MSLESRAEEIFEQQMQIARNRLCARLGYTYAEAIQAERDFLSRGAVKSARTRTRRSKGEGHDVPYVSA